MKGIHSLSGIQFLLISMTLCCAALLATPVVSASADRDDWRVVSAPPPPGPYRPVNLDPRVPGQAGIPVTGNRMPETTGAASAAGPRAYYQEPVNPAPRYQAPMNRLSNMQEPVKRLPLMQTPMNQPAPRAPGGYQQRMYRPSANAYPGPAGYPGEKARQDAVTKAPGRYYPAQPYPDEEEVPPPPVYDGMMQSYPGGYQSGAGR